MSDLSISQLGVLTNGQLAATDLEVSVDVSDLAMAPSGTDKRMTAQEKAWAYVRLSQSYRGLVVASTAYNPGDYVTLLDGRIVEIIIPVTSSVSATIGSANYILVVPQFYIIASSGMLYDSNPVSAAANTVALQAYLNMANPTGANASGGKVLLSRGGFYTNAFEGIPNGVTLEGNSTFGTYWSLADGSNCSVVGPHVSTGAGNANAFYWGLRDVSIDCRQALQGARIDDAGMTATSTTITAGSRNWVNGERVVGSGILPDTTIVSGGGTTTGVMSAPAEQTLTGATVFCGVSIPLYGVHCNINPLTSQQSGDWGFDPSGLISNVVIKNARDAAFANLGRSANVYFRCKSSASLGLGFIGSFDSRYNSCESDYSAWHGFDFRGSSQQITNCKSYNSGQSKTTAAAAANTAHGYKVNFYTYIAIAGCDAQQCTGDAFRLEGGATGISIGACTAAEIGYLGTSTAVAFRLDNAQGCMINATAKGFNGSGTSALALTSGSDKNTVFISHGGTGLGTPMTAASAFLNNTVCINGTFLNAPGLVASATVATALAKPYSRVSSSGGNFYTPGVPVAAAVAVLNRAEFVRLSLSDRVGQTITTLIMRVGGAGVATAIFRMGIYTSDFTGSDTWQLLAELPSTIDASTSGVKTTTFSSPLTVDQTKLHWICTVPQVALGATFTSTSGDLVATSNSLGATAAFTNNSGFSGALPATIAWGTAGAPGGIGSAIQVTAVVLG